MSRSSFSVVDMATDLVASTLNITLRPQVGDREKVVVEVLKWVVDKLSQPLPSLYSVERVVNVEYIEDLIEQLENSILVKSEGGSSPPGMLVRHPND
jgi:hypothetical protein